MAGKVRDKQARPHNPHDSYRPYKTPALTETGPQDQSHIPGFLVFGFEIKMLRHSLAIRLFISPLLSHEGTLIPAMSMPLCGVA